MRVSILSLVVALQLVVVTGCGPPTTPDGKLGPGERLRSPLTPIPGPTEENPLVTLHLIITDAETKAPLPATVSVDGRVVETNVAEIELFLPGRLRDRRVPITVTAPGYAEWGAEVNWNLNHSRVITAPIELTRLSRPE